MSSLVLQLKPTTLSCQDKIIVKVILFYFSFISINEYNCNSFKNNAGLFSPVSIGRSNCLVLKWFFLWLYFCKIMQKVWKYYAIVYI